ncbi:MAG: hypothetical protein RBR49_12495 [Desulfovibrio desulfuricans]|nr:hypothetical protein [Desulfovibrio desulfuricans]
MTTKDEDFEAIREACPYNIPRKDEKTGRIVKCDLCVDRVHAGQLPMCVKSCAMGASGPSGSLAASFG